MLFWRVPSVPAFFYPGVSSASVRSGKVLLGWEIGRLHRLGRLAFAPDGRSIVGGLVRGF